MADTIPPHSNFHFWKREYHRARARAIHHRARGRVAPARAAAMRARLSLARGVSWALTGHAPPAPVAEKGLTRSRVTEFRARFPDATTHTEG